MAHCTCRIEELDDLVARMRIAQVELLDQDSVAVDRRRSYCRGIRRRARRHNHFNPLAAATRVASTICSQSTKAELSTLLLGRRP